MRFGWFLMILATAVGGTLTAATIHETIDQGDSAAVAAMLDENPALLTELAPNTRTPLHSAAYTGKLNIVQLLISRGADVNATTSTGSTPLHGATLYNHEAIVRLLVANGGNVNASNQGGYTPITNAVSSGNLSTIKFLVESGASITSAPPGGRIPLHSAILSCNLPLVEYLLSAGADPKAVNPEGEDAVATAVLSSMWRLDGYENLPAILEVLLKAGGDPNHVLGSGRTPIMWAAGGNDTAIVRILVEGGANPSAVAANGATPFGEAVESGALDAAKYLAGKGAITDAVDSVSGRTPLHFAVLRGEAPMVETVFPVTSKPNLIDSTGLTPLDIALRYGHTQITEYLQEHGATAAAERGPLSSTYLPQRLAASEACLWYLGGCGYLIRTRNHCLVFDYCTHRTRPSDPSIANGFINPSEFASEDVTVFVTHEHGDHFDSTIFSWPGRIPKLEYLFGFHPDSLEVAARQGYSGQPYEYVGPGMTKVVNGMKVMAVRSNDAGVGFVVEVDGLTIYHAGDLAGWLPDQRDGFTSQVDSIDAAYGAVDIALVNVTGCHHQDTLALAEGTEYTLDKLQPKLVIPTHGYMRENYYVHFMGKFKDKYPSLQSFCPIWRGDAVRFTGGKKDVGVEVL
jgi:ankyrin repeat protein